MKDDIWQFIPTINENDLDLRFLCVSTHIDKEDHSNRVGTYRTVGQQ